MTPGGSRGRQKPLSGAPRAASWAARAQLGTHFDARRAHLGVLGLNLELRGLILLPRWTVLGAPGLHFEGPGAPRGSILSILQQICRIHENH